MDWASLILTLNGCNKRPQSISVRKQSTLPKQTSGRSDPNQSRQATGEMGCAQARGLASLQPHTGLPVIPHRAGWQMQEPLVASQFPFFFLISSKIYFFLSLPESQNVSHPSSGMVPVQECFILITGAFPAQQGLKLLPLGLYKVRIESGLQ